MNIQRANINWDQNSKKREAPLIPFEKEVFQQITEAIQLAKRPLILAGGGIRAADSITAFRAFVRLTQIPVVMSLMGVDTLPFSTPLRVGFIGSYGNRWANLAIGRSDLILVLGSRLNIRQTGADTDFFKGVIHIDCEEGEINNRIKGCTKVVTDLRVFFKKANEIFKNQKFELNNDWNLELTELKKKWPDISEIQNVKGINPNFFIHRLSQVSKECCAYVTDVGNHQMWAAQSVEIAENQFFITSGGMGAMGFGLPTSIGVTFATGMKPTVLIAGDGGFQLNIQELQTVVRNKLPIKLIVMNNKALGMIRQFQDSYFEGRYQSTFWGYDTPDFESVAKSYKIKSKTISSGDEIEGALKWMWEDPYETFLLQVMIDTFTNVYPKIAFGKPITEMEPLSKPIEMEGT